MATNAIAVALWTFALVVQSLQNVTISSARVFDGCSTRVTVDADRGLDCSSLDLGSWEDLNRSVCDSLQDVLDVVNASEQWSDPQPSDCVEIFLVAGRYEVSAARVLSGVSVVLRGEYNGTETFTSTTLPQYCIGTPSNRNADGGNNNNNNNGNNNNNNNNGGNNNNNNNGNDNNGSGNNNNNRPPPPSPRQAPMMPSDEVDLSLCDKVPYEDEFLVHVTFSVNVTHSVDRDGNTRPFYAWYFVGSAQVEMSGIDFSGSPGILGFEDIEFVSMENCSFSYFRVGAVDIFNAAAVYVSNSVFAHNGPGDVMKQQRYRGHSPSLSIAFTQRNLTSSNLLAVVSNCVFYNNVIGRDTARPPTITSLLENFRFCERGGGLAVISSSTSPADITIQDCLIARNVARASAGGVFIFMDGVSNHRVRIHRVQFRRNRSTVTGGGLEIGMLRRRRASRGNSIEVHDSSFSDNMAQYGGGAYFLPVAAQFNYRREISDRIEFHSCSFSDNSAMEAGSAIGASSPQVFEAKEYVNPLEIRDCSFSRNRGHLGGVVSTAYFPLAFHGTNTFVSNRGPSFSVIGAKVQIHGSLTFRSNNDIGFGTGALYVTSLGQLKLYSGSTVSFLDNRGGSAGAALVIDTIKVPDVFSRLLHNPLCSLLLEMPTVSPANWHQHNVSFTFEGNRALLVGSAVLLSNVNLCSWTDLMEPHFNPQGVFRWPFINYGTNGTRRNRNEAHNPDQFNPEWYVQTLATRMNITNTSVAAFPGEEFSLGVQAYDELDKPVTAVLRLSELPSKTTGNLPPETFMGLVVHKKIQSGVATTSFRQQGRGDSRGRSTVVAESILADVAAADVFTLKMGRCPPGTTLQEVTTSGYYVCRCNSDNEDIVNCETATLHILDHLWGSVNREGSGDRLVTHPCPGGYCRCTLRKKSGKEECPFIMDVRKINDQCDCDRKGLLCGECRDGMGVSALLNRCVECDLGHGFLIMGLIIADVLIVLGLLAVMVPFPPWLYPCIFHLQMLPYLTEHFPVTFEKARPYLYYVSSATGFYFPYDFCLGEAMDPRASYAIRYIPFLVAVFTCAIVLIVRWYKVIPVSFHGLWWMVLLLYTPVVHTSMSLLNCPMITDKDGGTVPRWYISGELECFTDPGHAVLGLFAIAVLVFCLLIIGAVVTFTSGKMKGPRWMLTHHLVKPLTNDFVLTWWGGVELARRILLLIFIVAFPNNNYPAIFILAILMAWYGMVQPYKRLSANVLEIALSSTVLLMLYITNTEQIYDDWQVLPDQSVLNDGSGGRPDCVGMEDIDGMTPMVILLAVLYYIPLLLTVGVVVIWIAFLARSHRHVIKRFTSRKSSRWDGSRIHVGSLKIPQRPRTFSAVPDVLDLSPPPATPPGIIRQEVPTMTAQSLSGVYFKYSDQNGSAHQRSERIIADLGRPQHHLHKKAAKTLSCPVEGTERPHPQECKVDLTQYQSNPGMRTGVEEHIL